MRQKHRNTVFEYADAYIIVAFVVVLTSLASLSITSYVQLISNLITDIIQLGQVHCLLTCVSLHLISLKLLYVLISEVLFLRESLYACLFFSLSIPRDNMRNVVTFFLSY